MLVLVWWSAHIHWFSRLLFSLIHHLSFYQCPPGCFVSGLGSLCLCPFSPCVCSTCLGFGFIIHIFPFIPCCVFSLCHGLLFHVPMVLVMIMCYSLIWLRLVHSDCALVCPIDCSSPVFVIHVVCCCVFGLFIFMFHMWYMFVFGFWVNTFPFSLVFLFLQFMFGFLYLMFLSPFFLTYVYDSSITYMHQWSVHSHQCERGGMRWNPLLSHSLHYH